MHQLLFAACCLTFLSPSLPCLAQEIPAAPTAQVSADQSSCREISALAQKYGADRKLPDSVVVGGAPCPRGEAASCLLAVMDKVLEKCGKEGDGSVSPEDRERISALREAFMEELERSEGYRTRRDEIERMLSKPETPEFVYRVGVNGFLRGDASANFSLPDNSFTPGHGEGRFVYRVKPYAYWHPTDWLDIHAEGQGYGYSGGSSQEYNKVSLYQGFVEAKFPGNDRLALKGGRQEFVYGSAFILGADSFFDGLTFDAARLRVKPATSLTVDFILGSYATPFSGGVEGNLAGTYASYGLSEGHTIEAYVLRDSGSTNHFSGEYLSIWGGRGMAKAGPVTVEFEPVYESGLTFNSVKGGNDRIDAFGGHLDATFAAALAGYENTFFTSYAYGSGSSAAANGVSTAREFSNPDNDNSLMGDMHVIGDLSGVTVDNHHASGLQIYTLGWGVEITERLNFSATGRYFRANNVETGFSKNLGLETDFTLTCALSDRLTLLAGYDRFFTGSFFRDASGSGRDIDYGYLMLQFDISRTKPKVRLPKG
jgi:hypothetical protein